MPLNRGLLLAALAVTLLTARLGFWQLDRAAQKTAMQASLDSRAALPALSAADMPRSGVLAPELEQRQARLQGRWLNDFSIYLDNRPMQGRTGFYLVTPLLLDDGSAVLVQRGWLPRDMQDRTRLSAPPPTDMILSVQGRVAPALARLFELGDAASGPIRQNLAIDVFASETRLRLRPWVLVQQASPSASPPTPSDGLLRDWPAPQTGVHKHYGYAFQWFSLSLLTVALYVWFQFIRPWRQQKRDQQARS